MHKDRNGVGFKIGLLGLGTVGTGIAQILQSPKGRHPLLQEIEIGAVGVRTLGKARPSRVRRRSLHH